MAPKNDVDDDCEEDRTSRSLEFATYKARVLSSPARRDATSLVGLRYGPTL